MGILDERNEFCDAQALNTGAAGTYNIGDVIDLSTVPGDMGFTDLYLVISVATGIRVAAGSGTVQFALVSDDSGTPATNGTQTTHLQSAAFATSTTSDAGALKAGTVLMAVKLPHQGNLYERYLGVQQITGTTALSAGAVDAFLTNTPTRWTAYDAPFQL